MRKTLITSLLFIISFVSVFSIVRNICDSLIIGKWIGFLWVGLFGMLIISLSNLKNINLQNIYNRTSTDYLLVPLVITGICISFVCILQLTLLPSANNTFHASADYDNPAGVSATLVSTYAFIYSLVKDIKKRIIISSLIFTIEILVLYFIQSRAGIISLTLCYLLLIFREKNKHFGVKAIILLLFTAIILFIALSVNKTDSTNGRILILKCSWEMIKDAPFWGHGMHGFRSQYMLYQANYLSQINSERLNILADNITHPLNEFILILINFGFFGFLLILFSVAMIFRHYIKNKSINSYTGITVLTGIICLSFFSYPLRYPITIISIFIGLYLVFIDLINYTKPKFLKVSSIIIISSSIVGFNFIIPWTISQVKWGILEKQSIKNIITKTDINKYEKLYNSLHNDPYFLYNYAIALSKYGDNNKALRIASDSFDLMANYDTSLLLARIFTNIGSYNEIEHYYLLSSKMCPSRFVPQYGLFKLYQKQNKINDMIKIGNIIINKPIKIPSPTIRQIRLSVKQTLVKYSLENY